MISVAKKVAVGSAFALFASTALSGVASAEEAKAVTFGAVDNKDCTATFTIENTTNSDWQEINYWTGILPGTVPAFGKNGGSEQALKASPATKDSDGAEIGSYTKNRLTEQSPTNRWYVKNLDKVTSTKIVDFSEKAATDGVVEVAYRMTGLERNDYDQALKTLTVTGCDTDDDTDDGTGSLGSGSTGSTGSTGGNGSLGSLFGSRE